MLFKKYFGMAYACMRNINYLNSYGIIKCNFLEQAILSLYNFFQ